MAPKIKSKAGQSVLEITMWTPIFLSCCLVLITLLYGLWIQLWLRQTIYEGLVCLNSYGETQLSCEKKALNQIKKQIPLGKTIRLELRGKKTFKGIVVFKWNNIYWTHKDKIQRDL